MADEVEIVEVSQEFQELKRAWWLLALLGVVSIGIGGLLIFWPGPTITTITTIFGMFMIIAGVVRFFVAVFDSGSSDRWLMVFSGIVGVVLGVVVVKNPELTIKVIVLVTAIFWLVSGMVDLFRGIANQYLPDRGLRIVFGGLTALFGVVVLVWPDVTVGVFAVLMGIYTVFFGLIEIVAAFQLKKA